MLWRRRSDPRYHAGTPELGGHPPKAGRHPGYPCDSTGGGPLYSFNSLPVKIAINTGGGDAPGLNAVIRAVVLSATTLGWTVYGIRRGYQGLFEEDGVVDLTRDSVRGITHLGGTILVDCNIETFSIILSGMNNQAVKLRKAERRELEVRVRSRRGRADDARIARVLLLLADGATYVEVAEKVGCSAPFISKWKRRFVAEGLAGLYNRHRGRPVSVLTPKVEARILNWTRKKPTDGSTHWSTRRLATKLGVHHMMVARVWKKHGLQPHRMERYMASNDPNFEDKAADVIGLYLKPPQNAVVFCVDEKTAIQALDRKDPVLPLSPGRAERHGFEYVRHGTLSLYAAFDTQTGAVLGKTAARHTSQEFVAFLSDLVAQQAEGQEIHVICDNLSAHKTQRVSEFLEVHPTVHMHFTPTYSSWLNQVELWFSKIERDLIYRGVFTSTKQLARGIMTYIRKYNQNPKPVKWRYDNPARRIRATK